MPHLQNSLSIPQILETVILQEENLHENRKEGLCHAIHKRILKAPCILPIQGRLAGCGEAVGKGSRLERLRPLNHDTVGATLLGRARLPGDSKLTLSLGIYQRLQFLSG